LAAFFHSFGLQPDAPRVPPGKEAKKETNGRDRERKREREREGGERLADFE